MFIDPPMPPARTVRSRFVEHRMSVISWSTRAAIIAVAVTVSTLVPVHKRVFILALIGIGGLAIMQAAMALIARRRVKRLEMLASRLGMTYVRRRAWSSTATVLSGVTDPALIDAFSRHDDGATLTLGTLRFSCERAGVHVTERWALIEWAFDSGALPHIFVQAVGRGSRTLPAALDSDQRRALEGDFPRHYSVFCRPGSERDALYILTPDLMAALVDQGRAACLEVNDGALRLYSPYAFDAGDVRAWSDRNALIAGVGAKAVERVRRLGQSSYTAKRATAESTPRLRSTARSNPSTVLVELACALVVAGVFIWAWTH